MVESGFYRLLSSARRSILAAMLLGVAAAWMAHSALGLDAWYIAKTAAQLGIGGLLMLQGLRGYHPFDRLGAANHITMARGVLVILLVGLIGMGAAPPLQWAALCIAAVASALDGVDGWAARQTQMSSAYGARFDMETDALLILVLTVLAWQFGKVGLWVLASGLMRYVFVAASLLFAWLRRPLPASRRRKTAAVAQTIALLVALAPFVPPKISGSLCAGALAVLAWSFLLDIAWLRRHALDAQAAS
jgi:phosphatidylglycerophosphate synthase